MLKVIGDAIQAQLEGLGKFKAVEQGFSQRALQSPPSAVYFLVSDEGIVDEPAVTRKLTYEIALLINYTDPVKAQEQMEATIDDVRSLFTLWEPVESGCQPSSVTNIRYEGVEGTLLIYSARVALEVYPQTINA